MLVKSRKFFRTHMFFSAPDKITSYNFTRTFSFVTAIIIMLPYIYVQGCIRVGGLTGGKSFDDTYIHE